MPAWMRETLALRARSACVRRQCLRRQRLRRHRPSLPAPAAPAPTVPRRRRLRRRWRLRRLRGACGASSTPARCARCLPVQPAAAHVALLRSSRGLERRVVRYLNLPFPSFPFSGLWPAPAAPNLFLFLSTTVKKSPINPSMYRIRCFYLPSVREPSTCRERPLRMMVAGSPKYI